MNFPQITPPTRLLKIPEWGAQNGLNASQSYYFASKLPPGVRVKVGGQLRLHAERLEAYLAAGGELARH